MRWTTDRIDLLRRLWGAGETAAAIGDRLGGMSRSAVLGKIFRLRLDVAVSGTTSQKRGKPAAAAPGAGAAQIARRRRSPKRSQQPQHDTKRHKTLLGLTNNTCRSEICDAEPKKIGSSATAGTSKIVRRLPRWRKNSTSMPTRCRRCVQPSRRSNWRARSLRHTPRSVSPASSFSGGSWRAP
jgi:hypothetical protein